MRYEELLKEHEDVLVLEECMDERLKGLCTEDGIMINSGIDTDAERVCVLAEELGHHFTSEGEILDQSSINNRKQEAAARKWACRRLLSLSGIIEACEAGCANTYEIAEYLNITEAFLLESLNFYSKEYGQKVTLGRYTLHFNPFGFILYDV